MATKERLKQVLEEMPDVETATVIGDWKLIATVVSDAFRDRNEAQRQETVWSYIRGRATGSPRGSSARCPRQQDERGIELSGYGSWTLRNAPKERGAEPDECYIVGDTNKDLPDLAIEVIWSHGGLDKLEIYRGLGVAEVWVWDRDEGLRVFALSGERYTPRAESALFPEFDLAWFARFLEQPTQSQAVRALRTALR